MYEFSAVDGFVEISESLGEMIKYLANEPSVGLYYIQQHAQNAVPNVIHLKNNVGEKSHHSILHTEDLEDSISAVKSMKECGFPIAEEMIKEINRSLSLMSTKQPARGLIQPRSSSLWAGSSSSWSPATWNLNSANSQGNGEKTVGYFSNVIKTAKQKAGNLKRQLDLRELREFGAEESLSYPDSNELTESNSAGNPEEADDNRSYNYDSFKADREANLEDWLKDNENMDQQRHGQY